MQHCREWLQYIAIRCYWCLYLYRHQPRAQSVSINAFIAVLPTVPHTLTNVMTSSLLEQLIVPYWSPPLTDGDETAWQILQSLRSVFRGRTKNSTVKPVEGISHQRFQRQPYSRVLQDFDGGAVTKGVQFERGWQSQRGCHKYNGLLCGIFLSKS